MILLSILQERTAGLHRNPAVTWLTKCHQFAN